MTDQRKHLETKQLRDAFDAGYRAGLKAYAWWKDGVQYVGTCGQTLHAAIDNYDDAADVQDTAIAAERERRGR